MNTKTRIQMITPRLNVILLLFCLLAVSPALAQRPAQGNGFQNQPKSGKVSGLIVDESSEEPIASASVSVWSASDSSLVTGAITTPDGRFSIEGLSSGEYFINVSFVGYESISNRVALTSSALIIDLGNLTLEIDRALLGEVEVSAVRDFMEVKIDRTVFNTENQTVTTGGSVTDLLQTIPSVDVDTDGNVSLRGSQNVVIQMNGRPMPVSGTMLAALLQQLPSDAISKIEVMPNPSAKYDPDGMAGIINIVTKQGRDLGLNGSVSVGYGTTDRYNGSAFVSYQRGKWNLSANYGVNRNARGGESNGLNVRENFYVDPVTVFSQTSFGVRNSLSNLFSANADYRIDPKNTLSLATTVSVNRGDNVNTTETLNTNSFQTILDRFDRVSSGDDEGMNMDFAMFYDRKFDKEDKSFRAETSFNRSYNDDYNQFEQLYYDILTGDPFADPELEQDVTDAAFTTGVAQFDYVNPLNESTRLEFGAKSTLRIIDQDFSSSDFDYFQNQFLDNLNLSNQFQYNETVHAAYAQLGRNFGKFNAQAGLRAEQVFTSFDLLNTNESFENDYFSLYPSVFASYDFTDNQQVKASYSKRVNRPRTRVLNPFQSLDDPLNVRKGNPYLNPEYTNAFELSFSQFTRKGMFTVTPFFRRTIDAIERFKTLDTATGISTTTFENFAENESWGVSVSTNYRPSRRTSLMVSFDGSKEVTNAGNLGSEWNNDSFAWSVRTNMTINLTNSLDLQGFWFYRAPREFALGKISAFQMANISLRQKFWNNQGSLSLRLQDPFDQMGFNFDIADENYSQLSNRKWESRVAWLTFQYNFGDSKRSFNDRNRNRGDSDFGGGSDIGLE